MVENEIRSVGGAAFVVGGAVRDYLLGKEPKDFDVECFHIESSKLEAILKRHGKVDFAGKSFGVFKLSVDGEIYDFSLPRSEIKSGEGYTGFDIEVNPNLSIESAAERRDFTINAIYYDLRVNDYIFPARGRNDLAAGIIRHTSDKFSEDPLRVLRAFQFSSRLGFQVAQETIELCRSIKDQFSTLSTDRVWIEWEKWANKSKRPELGIQFLIDCEWIEHFPLLHKLIGIKQSPVYHPEGDVMSHTLHCLAALRRLMHPISDVGVVTFATLLHDLGKITHTQFHECGKITAYGHEMASGPLAKEFLLSIRAPNHYIERVVPLVMYHMFQNHCLDEKSVRRMALKLAPASIKQLCNVMEADKRGRPPRPDVCPDEIDRILYIAADENVSSAAPQQIVLGRHLLELGCKPGKQMGALLARCFEAQLDGKFSHLENGIEFAKTLL